MRVRDGKGAGGILISAEREVEGTAQPDAGPLPLPAEVQSFDDIRRTLGKLASFREHARVRRRARNAPPRPAIGGGVVGPALDRHQGLALLVVPLRIANAAFDLVGPIARSGQQCSKVAVRAQHLNPLAERRHDIGERLRHGTRTPEYAAARSPVGDIAVFASIRFGLVQSRGLQRKA
jgi:hypothetical protein